jgi:hypothetical protein
MTALSKMIPPSAPPRSKALVGQDDPSGRYKIMKRVAILDAHEPIEKTCFDPKAVSRTNPRGIVKRMLCAEPSDLRTLARNVNRAIESGRFPVLQLGHTPLDNDIPEAWQPKPVCLTTNYQVGDLDGTPCLFADLCYLRSEADEAQSYPNLSVERVGFDDLSTHSIGAVALLRREPERKLPMATFAASGKLARCCYSRERQVISSEPLSTELMLKYSAEHGIFDPAEVRRRLLRDEGGWRTNYEANEARRIARSAPVPVASESVGSMTTAMLPRDPQPILPRW